MKKIHSAYGSFFIILVLFFSACSKSATNNIPTDGKFMGSVQPWDDKSTALNSKIGITVSIDYPGSFTTTTDILGKYSFDNLDFDKYDLSFSKPGYGTYRIFSFAHNYNVAFPDAPTIVPTIQFGKISTTTISSFSFLKNNFGGLPGVSFLVSTSPTPTITNKSYVRYFLSTSASVSSTNYTAYSPVRGLITNSATEGFTNDELRGFGFSKGQTIYVKAYGESLKSNDYDDPNLRRRIFPNLNSKTVAAISFVMQ